MSQLDAARIAEWRELEQRGSLGNACLSPDFLLPAIQHLEPTASPRAVRAELRNGKLIGFGVFIRSGPTAKIPFPHLRLFDSKHTFTNGFLLDREYAAAALPALLQAMLASHRWSLALFVNHLQAESDSYRVLTAPGFPFHWEELIHLPRAVVRTSADFMEKHLPGRLKGDLRRKWKRLSERGTPEWRLVRSSPEMTEAVETFLHLEHMGWKGEEGSSLLSSGTEAQFFRDVTTNFAQRGRAFVLELRLDGAAIASTTVYVSGNTAFLFKVGWNPEFHAAAPCPMNVVEFAQRLPELGTDIILMDSCARTGSWFERYWRESYAIVSGFVVPRWGLGAAAVSGLKAAYKLKRGLAERRHKEHHDE